MSNSVAKKRKQMRERVKRQEAATAAAAAQIAAETVPTIAEDIEAESEADPFPSTPIQDTTLDSDQEGVATGKEEEYDIEGPEESELDRE